MGKGALRKNAVVAAEQGAISLVNPSGRLCFVYNGEVNLAPLSQMDLNGVTLVFNGKFDLHALMQLNLNGATVHFNGNRGNAPAVPLNQATQLRSLDLSGSNPSRSGGTGLHHVQRAGENRGIIHGVRQDPLICNQPGQIQKFSNNQGSRPERRSGQREVFEGGQWKVKSGGNQEPIGPNQRIATRSIALQNDRGSTENSSHIAESPLTDTTYLHPSRLKQLASTARSPPSEDGEVPDISSKIWHAQSTTPNVRDGSIPSDERVHDRSNANEDANKAQKRSPSASADNVTSKKPKLSTAESRLNDEANRLAAKELTMRMQLRARNVSDKDVLTSETERIRAISQQRADLQEQMARQQANDDSPKRRPSIAASTGRTESVSPPKKGLRVDRNGLPRASPLSNIGRLAQVQEDIVQTKVQCALAGKEIEQEQNTWGSPSDSTAQRCRDRDNVLQELINKRDSIRNDQQRLESFNKDVQLPIVKKEEREVSPTSIVQDIPPFVEESIDPAPAQLPNQPPQRQERVVRFNLTDVETLIDSVKRGP